MPPEPSHSPATEASDDTGVASVATPLPQSAGSTPPCKVYSSHGRRDAAHVEGYNFETPALLSERETAFLQAQARKWSQHIAGKLSMLLKVAFHINPEPVNVMEYEAWAKQLPSPTHLRIFTIKDLPGSGILQIPSTLCGAWITRLLGGKCTIEQEHRYLSEIESYLLEDIVQSILNGWIRLWDGLAKLECQLVGQESSARFLQVALPHTAMVTLQLTFELEPGGSAPIMRMAVPLATLQPLLKTMRSQAAHTLSQGSKALQWQTPYDWIKIPVYATWEATPMTVRDLLALRPGDVLLMPEDIVQRTCLKLDNTLEFVGEIGLEKTKMALRIERRCSKPSQP